MKKTILEIYALAVCFVTVTGFCICLGVASYSILQIAKPDFTLSARQYDQYQSNDAYWADGARSNYCADEQKNQVRPPENELSKKRMDDFAHELASEQREGAQSLVKILIIMLVDILAFTIHWLIAGKARMPS